MSSLDMARKKSVPNKNVQQSKVDEISSKNERITRHSKRLEEKKISAVDHTSSKNRRSTRQNKQKKEKTAEIETKIEPLVESEAVDTLSSIYKCKVPSCQNLKPFSSLSSLNQHNRVKHEGIRWICPFCQEEQSSKYSQERHIKRHHNKNYKGNPDQNQYELGYRVKMTEKAKDVLLGKLVEKVEYQDKLIDQLKNRLRAALTKLTKFEGKSTSEPKTDVNFVDTNEEVIVEGLIEMKQNEMIVDESIEIDIEGDISDVELVDVDVDDDYQESYGANDPIYLRSQRLEAERKLLTQQKRCERSDKNQPNNEN